MWRKALNVIPEVSKSEWDQLDVISKWLISTRAAVLIMTFISAALAGLFAWRDNSFSFLPWLALTLGLILAHASNNIFNDYTDFVRGVDKDNYFRTIYGAQPIASGLMTPRQHLTYFAVTGLLALTAGLYLIFINAKIRIWMLLGRCLFRPLLHLAAEVHRTWRNRCPAGVGTSDDWRRLLCAGPPVELECRDGKPSLRIGCDHCHLRQAHR
jgi:1,4-dihydroxy-2-naphthoate octaprenyltransferase